MVKWNRYSASSVARQAGVWPGCDTCDTTGHLIAIGRCARPHSTLGLAQLISVGRNTEDDTCKRTSAGWHYQEGLNSALLWAVVREIVDILLCRPDWKSEYALFLHI